MTHVHLSTTLRAMLIIAWLTVLAIVLVTVVSFAVAVVAARRESRRIAELAS